MSRPQKTAHERRSRHVIFRLTEAEYLLLSHKAALAGLPPNELARQLTRKGHKTLTIRTSRRCDPAFLKRIDQIGHNINQVVKNAHIFGRISPRMESLCTTIDELINEALKEDGHDT